MEELPGHNRDFVILSKFCCSRKKQDCGNILSTTQTRIFWLLWLKGNLKSNTLLVIDDILMYYLFQSISIVIGDPRRQDILNEKNELMME